MVIKINNVELSKYPSAFEVTTLDIDNSESTFRSADGTLTRDRIAVKKQINIEWAMSLTASELASILTSVSGVFFDVYYLDPVSNTQETRKFYVGNRSTPFVYSRNGVNLYKGLKMTFTEQ